MRRAIFAFAAAAGLAAAAAGWPAPAEAREQIRIVGSSTVYPFATTVAEEFGRSTRFPTPVVESTGTGGGFKLFCSGLGPETPDITNASRAVKDSEVATCAENGVEEITEVKIGFDGIVVANARTAPRLNLTLRQLYLALGKLVPAGETGEELVPNPYTTWREIDPSLPDEPIEVLGPPPTSGTRDAFNELAMEGGCKTFPAVAALAETDKSRFKAVCRAIREDGAYVEAGENDNLIVQKLEANPGAVGVFGYSFLAQNRDRLHGSLIGGVAPTFEAIAGGAYPISRSLYFYVKNAHVGVIPGIPDYLAEFTSEEAIGEFGYLAERGLIPLPEGQRERLREEAGALAPAPAETHRGLQILLLLAALALLSAAAFYVGRVRAVAAGPGAGRRLHSLPGYYGYYVALWCALPGLLVFAAWLVAEPYVIEALVLDSLPRELLARSPERLSLLLNDIRNLAAGQTPVTPPEAAVREAADHWAGLRGLSLAGLIAASLGAGAGGMAWAWRRVEPDLRARVRVERTLKWILFASSTIAILVTIGIVLSLLFEAIRFFRLVPVTEFLFGLHWSPQIAIRADQVASEGSFGAVPVFTGTLLITAIAMAVAAPVGLMSAIYMSDYATPRIRATVKPILEILAGVPTVVYGFFAAITLAPFLRRTGESLGLDVASESALAAGLVMGIMIIPFISSLSDDVINAVPQAMRNGSYALGATKSETVRKVVVPAALPGIVGAILLGISRAIGETMIVVMAAGLAANLTANPLEAVTTVTVQIVTLLVGDQEFDSAKTLAAFALGLVLFVATLILNLIAIRVVQRYREKYE